MCFKNRKWRLDCCLVNNTDRCLHMRLIAQKWGGSAPPLSNLGGLEPPLPPLFRHLCMRFRINKRKKEVDYQTMVWVSQYNDISYLPSYKCIEWFPRSSLDKTCTFNHMSLYQWNIITVTNWQTGASVWQFLKDILLWLHTSMLWQIINWQM